MWYSKTRLAVVACGLAAAMFLAPSQSEGGLCDWMCPSSWCSPGPCPTTYAPPYTTQRVTLMPIVSTSASVCTPVARTCSYVPQTTYRWSYSRIERTSYRPVASVDPCTGCATTVYQPVTRRTLLPWLHRKPVTTYRMVCSDPCVPSSGIVGSACCPPSCVSGGVVGTVGTVLGSSCPSGCVPATTVPGPITSSPSLDPGYGAPSTFKTEQGTDSSGASGTQQSDLRLRPSSDRNLDPTLPEQPRLIEPYNRSAAKPIQYATYRHLTEAAPSTGAPSGASLDVDGWRASRD